MRPAAAAAGVEQYRSARESFFARKGAAWPGTLSDPFDILAPRHLPRHEINAIFEATRELGRVYETSASLLRRLPDQALVEMGVPAHVLPAVRCSIPGLTDPVIGRFDLARTNHGYKLLEFNADVPALIVEAFSINAEASRDAGFADPNANNEALLKQALREAVATALEYIGEESRGAGNVVVAYARGCCRDEGMAKYLCALLAPFRAKPAVIESLSLRENGLYDQAGTAIDVLYRIYPLQCIRDGLFGGTRSDLNSEMGGQLLRLVKDRRVALINPPFAFLLECKTLQAVIWNLAVSRQYFGAADRYAIERYMLPTYLDPPDGGTPYVMKPAYGAEGDTVRAINSDQTVMHQAVCTGLADSPMVYQEYVELSREEMMTEYGMRSLSLLTSCFLVAGKPAGICMRAGEAITDESAWVLPVCTN